ncbi:MAG: serine kinase [Armatimonadetes bacterium]|nr:serine kinase [Armatimonadota bacterium]
MTVSEMAQALGLKAVTAVGEQQIQGAMAADLISDVLANGAPGQVWLTIQTHRNVAAVASTQDLAAVVITGGREPNNDLIALANHESVTILLSNEDTYAVAGRLYALGVR